MANSIIFFNKQQTLISSRLKVYWHIVYSRALKNSSVWYATIARLLLLWRHRWYSYQFGVVVPKTIYIWPVVCFIQKQFEHYILTFLCLLIEQYANVSFASRTKSMFRFRLVCRLFVAKKYFCNNYTIKM